jgi:hypothetical protein
MTRPDKNAFGMHGFICFRKPTGSSCTISVKQVSNIWYHSQYWFGVTATRMPSFLFLAHLKSQNRRNSIGETDSTKRERSPGWNNRAVDQTSPVNFHFGKNRITPLSPFGTQTLGFLRARGRAALILFARTLARATFSFFTS